MNIKIIESIMNKKKEDDKEFEKGTKEEIDVLANAIENLLLKFEPDNVEDGVPRQNEYGQTIKVIRVEYKFPEDESLSHAILPKVQKLLIDGSKDNATVDEVNKMDNFILELNRRGYKNFEIDLNRIVFEMEYFDFR